MFVGLPIERHYAACRAEVNAQEARGELTAAEAEREREWLRADLYSELQNL